LIKLLLLLRLLLPSNHQVTLNWNPSTTPQVSYFVYRGPTSGGELTQSLNTSGVVLGCTNSTSCTFVDTTVSGGQTYYYIAKAFDGINFSVASNEVVAVVPLNPATNLTLGNSH
jgi:hypothetical protein